VANFARGAVAVVGHRLDNDGNALRTVALVDDLFIVLGIARAERLIDSALDIIVRHIGGLCLGNDSSKSGVAARITAAALLDSHDHFSGYLGEGLRALGVSRSLGLLYVVPLGMS